MEGVWRCKYSRRGVSAPSLSFTARKQTLLVPLPPVRLEYGAYGVPAALTAEHFPPPGMHGSLVSEEDMSKLARDFPVWFEYEKAKWQAPASRRRSTPRAARADPFSISYAPVASRMPLNIGIPPSRGGKSLDRFLGNRPTEKLSMPCDVGTCLPQRPGDLRVPTPRTQARRLHKRRLQIDNEERTSSKALSQVEGPLYPNVALPSTAPASLRTPRKAGNDTCEEVLLPTQREIMRANQENKVMSGLAYTPRDIRRLRQQRLELAADLQDAEHQLSLALAGPQAPLRHDVHLPIDPLDIWTPRGQVVYDKAVEVHSRGYLGRL